jgi:hypothetical protein
MLLQSDNFGSADRGTLFLRLPLRARDHRGFPEHDGRPSEAIASRA